MLAMVGPGWPMLAATLGSGLIVIYWMMFYLASMLSLLYVVSFGAKGIIKQLWSFAFMGN